MSAPNENAYQGYFYFDPDDPIYQDHFPGKPVVPGSLIIHAFMLAARKRGATKTEWRIKDFRFKRFIGPGRYAFEIQPRSDGRLACALFDTGEVVATGGL